MREKKNIYLLPALLPPFLCLFLALVAYFASIPISYFFSPLNRIDSIFDLAVTPDIFHTCRSILYLVVFGLWYSHICFPGWTRTFGAPVERKTAERVLRAKYMHPLPYLFLLPLGFCLRYMLTAFLYTLQNLFPGTMEKYSSAIREMTTADASALYLISGIFLLPLAEEIIFRGVTLHFAKKALTALPAVIFSAFCYALYNLNLFESSFALIFGLILGFLKEKSGGILPPLLLHMTFSLAIYLQPKKFMGSTAGSVLVLVCAMLLSLALTFLSFRFYDGKRPFRSARQDTSASDSLKQP